MNLKDLGKRAVACKRWRWMGGMAVLGHHLWRVVERTDLPPYMVCGYEEELLDGVLPDLSDPATLGCLLHLVRGVWKDPDLTADRVLLEPKERDIWQVYVFHDSGVKDVLSGRSEVEALVAALEAAP